MTDHIAAVWKQGEECAAQGKLHEGLVSFLKAKTLIIEESKRNYDSRNRPGAANILKILGELMMKLNESIDKYLKVLHKNPLLTLRVKHGFTKKDIKKAYKMAALQYHPDKNQECDTSCIFTVVQSAYETLLASAPDDPPPTPAKKVRPRPSSELTAATECSKACEGGHSVHQEASGVAGMTSAQLRTALYSIGFTRLERASREELLRKYLAARSHFGKDKDHKAATGTADGTTEGHEEGDGTGGPAWRSKMAAEMRNERMREWEREGVNRRDGSTRRKDQQGAGGGGHAPDHSAAHSSADRSRLERVQKLRSELPTMRVAELRSMAQVCGVSVTGCIEKGDVLQALCAHYGITLPPGNEETVSPVVSARVNEHMQTEGQRAQADRTAGRDFTNEPRSTEGGLGSDQRGPGTHHTNPGKNVWTRERLAEMERKLRGSRPRPRKREMPGEEEGCEDIDGLPQTRIDAHMAEEERRYQQQHKVSPQRPSVASGAEGSPGSGQKTHRGGRRSTHMHNSAVEHVHQDHDDIADDDDDDGLEWAEVQGPSHASSTVPTSSNCGDDGASTPLKRRGEGLDGGNRTGSPTGRRREEELEEEFLADIHIPMGGLQFGVGGSSMFEDEEGSSGDSLDDFLMRPDLSPAELKARRMRRFDSQGDSYGGVEDCGSRRSPAAASSAKGSFQGGVKPDGDSAATVQNERERDAAELMALLGTLHMGRPVHVGVSLLSDDEEDEEGDGDTSPYGSIVHCEDSTSRKGIRLTPVLTRSIHTDSRPAFSPSATAWGQH